MNIIQEKNFKPLQPKEIIDLEPSFYSFGINGYVLLRNLKEHQRNIIKNIFSECYLNLKKIKNLDYNLIQDNSEVLIEHLISNLLYLSKGCNSKDYKKVIYGIYLIILKMKKTKANDFKLLKDILLFNDLIKKHSNKKLIRLYKKTYRDYNNSISLIENKDLYKNTFNQNIILETKRNDIVNEFKRRCKIAKICTLIDVHNEPKGDGYFIPRMDLDDDIVIFYKNTPYTLNDFKKTGLITKKLNGKICWK